MSSCNVKPRFAIPMCTVFVVVAIQVLSVFSVTSASSNNYYGQEPLLLTPYLKAGNAVQAQKLSQTYIGGRLSYSGYLTTDEKCGNNLFFWFFPAEINWTSAPVLLWLNGGPGISSTLGLFTEVGPWNHNPSAGFVNNKYTWTRDHNVLFIDQPVGVGFSFSNKECYASNITEVTDSLYSAVTQFFTLFQNLQKNTFFLTGEEFAGHFNIELAVKIDKANRVASNPKINLVGVLVGNPELDYGCEDNSDYLYQLGIVDDKKKELLKERHDKAAQAVNVGDYQKAINILSNGYYSDGLTTDFNILYDDPSSDAMFKYTLYMRDIATRALIHVGYTPFSLLKTAVLLKLKEETLKTERPNIEYLLQTGKYIVGFYSGQLDADNTVSTVTCTLRSLQWAGSQQYLNATRTAWQVSGRLAGWTKTAGNLLEVVVRDAGQYVPRDQGEAALDLIKTVVSSKPGSLTQFGQW